MPKQKKISKWLLKKYLLIGIIHCFLNSSGQNNEKYSISQDSKGKYILTNNQSKVIAFNKCESMAQLSGNFENSDPSWKDLLVINKGKMVTIYSQRRDTVVFKIECEEFSVKELGDAENSEPGLATKCVVCFDVKVNSKNKHLIVLVNTITAKVIELIDNNTSASYSRDRNFIKIFDHNTIGKADVQIKDLNGKVIVPFTNGYYFDEFNTGFIAQNGKPLFSEMCGVINKEGKTTVPFIYHRLTTAYRNYLIAEDTLKRVGLINSDNKIIVPFRYQSQEKTNQFGFPEVNYLYSNDGVFAFKKSSAAGDFDVVDTNNVILFQPGSYLDIYLLDNETKRYFCVKGKNGLAGVYDTKLRKEIFPCEYKFFQNSKCLPGKRLFLLKSGYIEAEKDGRWGILNLFTAKIQIPFDYSLENPELVINGQSKYFYLSKDGKRGMVSYTGETLIPFDYEKLEMIDGFFIVERKGLYGLVSDKTFKEVLPVEYSKISSDLKVEKIEANAIKKGVYTKEGIVIWEK